MASSGSHFAKHQEYTYQVLCSPGEVLAYSTSQIRCFAIGGKSSDGFHFQVLEGVIKYRWNALPVEQRDGMKNYISEVIVQV